MNSKLNISNCAPTNMTKSPASSYHQFFLIIYVNFTHNRENKKQKAEEEGKKNYLSNDKFKLRRLQHCLQVSKYQTIKVPH